MLLVYINDPVVDNSAGWGQVGYVDGPAGTNTIAVQCTDRGVIAVLMASSTSGLITDGSGSWWCTSTLETDWMNPSFDDSHWATALVKGNNGASPWRGWVLPNMTGAKWIWSSSPTYSTVYCRAHF